MKGMFEEREKTSLAGLRQSVGEKSEIKLERRVCQITADLEYQAKEFIFYSIDK